MWRQNPPNNIIHLKDRAGTILTLPVPECSGGLDIETCGLIVQYIAGISKKGTLVANRQTLRILRKLQLKHINPWTSCSFA